MTGTRHWLEQSVASAERRRRIRRIAAWIAVDALAAGCILLAARLLGVKLL